jgi:hypothetical protein
MKIVKNVQPPSGVSRALFRAPIYLYRLGLGWLFGKCILLLNHIGRVSGKQRQVILEVVEHDPTDGSFVVASGWAHRRLVPQHSSHPGGQYPGRKTHDPRDGSTAHCRGRGRNLRRIRCPIPRRGDIPAPSADGILSRRVGGRLPGGWATNAVRPVGYPGLKSGVSDPGWPSRHGRYQRFVWRTFQRPPTTSLSARSEELTA